MGIFFDMKNKKALIVLSAALILCMLISTKVWAAPGIALDQNGLTISRGDSPEETAASIQILLLFTVLTLAPSILIMMTSFTRIVIVLSFLRNALGTQQMPPNQVIIGLSLFLTLFVMTPVFSDLNEQALKPFSEGQIEQQAALETASGVMKGFMLSQMGKSEKDLALFVNLAEIETPVEPEALPLTVIVPAFLISELKIAFQMGFLIFIPFLIIDMVVSSTLMSMGMMMLPPVIISLPFKILLFISAGGWNLVIRSILNTFVR